MRNAGNPLRALPQVQRLLESEAAQALGATFGRGAVTSALRVALEQVRRRIETGELRAAPGDDVIVADAHAALLSERRGRLRRAINATGIVLHTNLGRAPLAREAVAAVAEVASGYNTLEFDTSSGARGSRTRSIEGLLRELTGAEAALAVNNGAAAILLVLSAHGGGGEVIVSRGELVEIGGGFRIPDVIRQGGARLVEVGATNKTRLADYRAAIGQDTRVLLKVHQSNFRTIGFTAEAGISELAHLAHEHGRLLVADLGSGLVHPAADCAEPSLREALSAGADIVTCSGDKLLGGPQAGLILGKEAAVAPLRQHPLLRALRLDKMSIAALEATLTLHRDRPGGVPVQRMLTQTPDEIRERALQLQSMLGQGEVEQTEAFAGGGALPEERRVSWGLALTPTGSVEETAARLRAGEPVVVGRINQGRVILDMLTVSEAELSALASAVRAVLS